MWIWIIVGIVVLAAVVVIIHSVPGAASTLEDIADMFSDLD